MPTSYDRQKARDLVAATLARQAGAPAADLAAALAAACPFAAQETHGRRLWQDEVRRQCGARPPASVDPRQLWLFDRER